MGKWSKLRVKILVGDSDANIAFGDLCGLLKRLGFQERVEEIINLQPKGRLSKAYQVGQVRTLILKYKLTS